MSAIIFREPPMNMDYERIERAFRSRGFDFHHSATAVEAAEYLLGQIHGTTVGIGGSKSIEALDVYNRLCEDNTVIWHWKEGFVKDVYRRAEQAEVYLSSANAITENGELVNIDGKGNRVAALSYAEGKRVFIVVGANKVCPDLESAIYRAKNVAAPVNVRKLPGKRPCEVTGKCMDCRSADRGCAVLQVIMFKPMLAEKYEVILVDEDLGF